MKPGLYNMTQIEQGKVSGRHIAELARHWQSSHGLTADGMVGPETRASIRGTRLHPASDLSDMWIRVAREEIGKGETDANNSGRDVDRYRFGRTRGSWCAWFLCWTLNEACGRLGVDVPIKITGGAKRLYRRVGKAGRLLDAPRLGAIACWDRGARGSWQGHAGLVVQVGRGSFRTIEGNRGRYPSKVREYGHEVGEGRLMGFALL